MIPSPLQCSAAVIIVAWELIGACLLRTPIPCRQGQTKPLMTRALLELTLLRTNYRSKALRGYRYEGDSAWTPAEVDAFKQGLREHGKNFPFIQTTMPTKSLPELVEYVPELALISSLCHRHRHAPPRITSRAVCQVMLLASS